MSRLTRRERAGKHLLGWACLLLSLLVLLIALQPSAQAAALRRGSSGDDVITLQKKLKSWGYYDGAVDGVFGSRTEAAVKYFQSKNGLTADGVVGEATARALGMRLSGGASSSSQSSGTTASGDTYLLAQCIYGEGRGESYKGQVAIAAVILNRTRNSSFPNSIAGVIYQPGAFDAVSDGQIHLNPDDTALRAARDAMNGYDPTNGCIYYYNPNTATNRWIRSRPIIVTIGRHVFCR